MGVLEAGEDLADLLVCSNVLAFEITQACHFVYTHNSRGQISSSENQGFGWRILVNDGKFGLVCHFGLLGGRAGGGR